MIKIWQVILLHQLIFQSMFVAKNIVLRKKIGMQIRGNNREANISIVFFIIFIGVAFGMSFFELYFGEVRLLSSNTAIFLGLLVLFVNIIISGFSLIHLKDSWRVGVLTDQETALISVGIYRFTRNPYFVSYLLMFAAYTILLQNLILLGLSLLGLFLIHKMITKEEKYLHSVHGENYMRYRKKVPRYILI